MDLGIAHAAAALAANRSFYMNLHFHISHAPLLPTDAQLAAAGLLDANKSCAWSGMPPLPAFFGGRCPMQTFRASQHAADAEIGRLLDWLIAENIEDDSIIFLTTDNGPEAQEVYFNSVGSAGQFRGRKRSLYEGGIRVPAVWRWPNVIPKNVTHRGVFGHVDFAPTILALTGVAPRVPAAATAAWAGVDASVALRTGAPPPPRAVALKWEWRFAVLGPCWDAAPRLAARDPLHPELIALWEPNATAHGETLRLELFNTTADPHEFSNLASARPDDAARLQALLAAWLVSLPAGPGVAQHPECGGSGAAGAPFARPLSAWADKEAAEGYASARDALPRDAAGLLRAA